MINKSQGGIVQGPRLLVGERVCGCFAHAHAHAHALGKAISSIPSDAKKYGVGYGSLTVFIIDPTIPIPDEVSLLVEGHLSSLSDVKRCGKGNMTGFTLAGDSYTIPLTKERLNHASR